MKNKDFDDLLNQLRNGEFDDSRNHYIKYLVYPNNIEHLMSFLKKSNFYIKNFNNKNFIEEAKKINNDHTTVENCDLETLKKLITLSINQDRISGGLMCRICESGLMTKVFNRLADLEITWTTECESGTN